MRTCLLSILLLGHLLLSAPSSSAATITVDVNGSGDFLSIPEGVDAASSGDTVLVLPGVYPSTENRNISCRGLPMVIMSRDGREATILNMDAPSCEMTGFLFDAGEGRDTIVDGFTVQGYNVLFGCSGFLCGGAASPTIRNCRFTECYADGYMHIDGWGAAGCVFGGSPLFEDCVFDNNHAYATAGGVFLDGPAQPIFERCVFIDNTDSWEGSGSAFVHDCVAQFRNCVFKHHPRSSAVVVDWGGYASFTNCTFVGNSGGPIIGTHDSGCRFDVLNSVFAFNDSEGIIGDDGISSVTHCCLYETGTDSLPGQTAPNIWLDPRFCGFPADDLTLCADSPCLPENNDWEELIGAYGEGCPPCGTAVERHSWGTIKALFR